MTAVLRAEIVFPIITCASWLDLLSTTRRCSHGRLIGEETWGDSGAERETGWKHMSGMSAKTHCRIRYPSSCLFLPYYHHLLSDGSTPPPHDDRRDWDTLDWSLGENPRG